MSADTVIFQGHCIRKINKNRKKKNPKPPVSSILCSGHYRCILIRALLNAISILSLQLGNWGLAGTRGKRYQDGTLGNSQRALDLEVRALCTVLPALMSKLWEGTAQWSQGTEWGAASAGSPAFIFSWCRSLNLPYQKFNNISDLSKITSESTQSKKLFFYIMLSFWRKGSLKKIKSKFLPTWSCLPAPRHSISSSLL